MSDASKKRKGEKYSPGTSKRNKNDVYEDKEQQQDTIFELNQRIKKK